MLQEANESRENRSLSLGEVIGIMAYFLALGKSIALSGEQQKFSPLENGGVCGDVPGCCLANSGVPWPLVGLASEPTLKKAKLEIVGETLPARLPCC